ncbi:hypothetical protein D3C81_2050970 [compost metagenome]
MSDYPNDGLGNGEPHGSHNAGVVEHGFIVLQTEHPREPIDTSQHRILAIIKGIDQHVPDWIQGDEANQ